MVKSSKTCCKSQKKRVNYSLFSQVTYLIVGHKTPCENADFLVEGDLVDAAGQVRAVAVNDVLEVLTQAIVEGL
jgi:hypothetical protein